MANQVLITDGSAPDSANPPAFVDSTGALKVSGGGASATVMPVTTGTPTGTASLTAATTGTGTAVDFGSAKAQISMLVVANGTVTAGVVKLQVSHNGTDFADFIPVVNTSAIATGVNHVLSVDGAYRYARAVITTNVTGGGSVTVTFMGA